MLKVKKKKTRRIRCSECGHFHRPNKIVPESEWRCSCDCHKEKTMTKSNNKVLEALIRVKNRIDKEVESSFKPSKRLGGRLVKVYHADKVYTVIKEEINKAIREE